jgi:hypothetical protein
MDALELLSRKLEEKKQMLIAAMAQGSAKDFAEYQNLCGRIRGLADTQMEVNDLLRKLKENDED